MESAATGRCSKAQDPIGQGVGAEAWPWADAARHNTDVGQGVEAEALPEAETARRKTSEQRRMRPM